MFPFPQKCLVEGGLLRRRPPELCSAHRRGRVPLRRDRSCLRRQADGHVCEATRSSRVIGRPAGQDVRGVLRRAKDVCPASIDGRRSYSLDRSCTRVQACSKRAKYTERLEDLVARDIEGVNWAGRGEQRPGAAGPVVATPSSVTVRAVESAAERRTQGECDLCRFTLELASRQFSAWRD